MSAPLNTALPYGIRDCKLTEYTDASGSLLAGSSVDLPNMQTFSFSETEEFSDLRGDDRLVATRGQGAQVEWELEAGGISFAAWAVMSGGSVIESGIAPNRKRTIRKRGSDARKYFRCHGRAISDSGGDVHAMVYRARVNDSLEGEFADGEFFVTSASGIGLPMLDENFDILYDFVQNETAVPITLTPEANPMAPPWNLAAGELTSTSVGLVWTPVQSATGYTVEQSSDGETGWAPATGGEVATNVGEASITGLTADTTYYFRVKAEGNGGPSDPSNTLQVTTPAS